MQASTDICQEVEHLLPLFALGTLGQSEQDYVSAHLDSCAGCRAALEAYERIGVGLLNVHPALDPPASVRRRLLQAARGAERSDRKAGLFEERRPSLAAAAAVVLLAVGAALTWQLVQLNQQLQQVQAQVERNQLAQAVMTYPTSRTATLEGDDAFGTVVFDPEQRLLAVYAWGLQPLPADQPYRAWLISETGEKIEAGVFSPSASDRFTMAVLWSPEPMAHYAGLRIGQLTMSEPDESQVILSADLQSR